MCLFSPPVSSRTPSSRRGPRNGRQTRTTWCQGLREAHTASLTLRSAPPVPVGYCNHGDQQVPPYHRRASLPAAGALGEAEGSLQQEGLACSTEDCGERAMETNQCG